MTSRAAESIVVFLNLNGVSCPPCAPRKTYDVCIVGSGAGGGIAAYALSKAGADVVLMEAGDVWYASRDSKMMFPTTRLRAAAARTPQPFGEFDGCEGGWRSMVSRHTAPGTRFLWWRARMLGGRTNHWGCISLRFGPDDFRRKTLDGMGDDWPISYDDVALITTASTRSSAFTEAARESTTSPTDCFNRRRLHAVTSC